MSDDEDDEETPFEQFDEEVGDREGDPFDALGGPEEPPDSDEGTKWAPDQEEQLGGDIPETPTEKRADDTPDPLAGGDTGGDTPDAESETLGDAFSTDTAEPTPPEEDEGTTDEFGSAGRREGDPFESAQQAFERMDVGELDADEVWETLSEAQQRGSVTEMEGRTYAEVSKHSYCEHCEFFSAPPNISCSNEGTEILEFVDMETVRVVDCPIVAERRELENE